MCVMGYKRLPVGGSWEYLHHQMNVALREDPMGGTRSITCLNGLKRRQDLRALFARLIARESVEKPERACRDFDGYVDHFYRRWYGSSYSFVYSRVSM